MMTPDEKEVVLGLYGLIKCVGVGGLFVGVWVGMLMVWEFLHRLGGGDVEPVE